MKKSYVTPSIELVEFNYSDQVVVASVTPGPGYQNSYTADNICHWVVEGCNQYYSSKTP